MDTGAWWAAIYGVAQSRTRLKRLSSSRSRYLFGRRRFKLITVSELCGYGKKYSWSGVGWGDWPFFRMSLLLKWIQHSIEKWIKRSVHRKKVISGTFQLPTEELNDWDHGSIIESEVIVLVASNSLRPHGILQARILQWVAIAFSSGSSKPRDWTQVSCIAGRFFTSWATREAQGEV